MKDECVKKLRLQKNALFSGIRNRVSGFWRNLKSKKENSPSQVIPNSRFQISLFQLVHL